ncbi:MAG: HAD family hydrolase [Euryarchaeota archaeon]|nr:HAD family hydrolase [Euryarchaeota archaeon]
MIKIQINNQTIDGIELVIFDKDGTLMDLYHYWSQIIGLRARFICERLGLGKEYQNNLLYAMGIDIEARKLRPEGPVGIKKKQVVLQTAADYLASIDYPEMEKLCIDVFDEVDELSSENLEQFIRPINGVYELIDEIINHGCKIAVATTDTTQRAKIAMDFLGISNKVDCVIGANLVRNSKPDPEMIHVILDTLKVDKSNAVMIGDAITDVQIGINADLKASIGVLTGLSSYEQLNAITPYIAKSVSKIKIS